MNPIAKTSLFFLLLGLTGFSALFAGQASASQAIPDSRWENLLSLSPPADSLDQETEVLVQKQVKQGFMASLLAIGLFAASSLLPGLMALGVIFAAIGWVQSRNGIRKLKGKRNRNHRRKAWFSFILGSLVGAAVLIVIGWLVHLLFFSDWG